MLHEEPLAFACMSLALPNLCGHLSAVVSAVGEETSKKKLTACTQARGLLGGSAAVPELLCMHEQHEA